VKGSRLRKGGAVNSSEHAKVKADAETLRAEVRRLQTQLKYKQTSLNQTLADKKVLLAEVRTVQKTHNTAIYSMVAFYTLLQVHRWWKSLVMQQWLTWHEMSMVGEVTHDVTRAATRSMERHERLRFTSVMWSALRGEQAKQLLRAFRLLRERTIGVVLEQYISRAEQASEAARDRARAKAEECERANRMEQVKIRRMTAGVAAHPPGALGARKDHAQAASAKTTPDDFVGSVAAAAASNLTDTPPGFQPTDLIDHGASSIKPHAQAGRLAAHSRRTSDRFSRANPGIARGQATRSRSATTQINGLQ
jgi:hypothetical protein